MFYSRSFDRNGGRERVGMGILIAKYLQAFPDERLERSLKRYTAYVERELFDTETGVVYNDYGRDNEWNRLCNYPWMSVFYTKLYALYGSRKYLTSAYRALCSFYRQGGAKFYAIEIPAARIIAALEAENMTEERETLIERLAEHCGTILKNGLNYPKHEVNYEQSIVAPAADLLLQMYEITRDEKYLNGAREQLAVLELFNGARPDYHLHEAAIRHWDGYWFGKRAMYGDTFPHYWSGLTANVYGKYAKLTGNGEYLKKADAARKAFLSLFFPDGSASCAYIYPASVNGKSGGFADPYANDQDWALYFNLRADSR